MTSSTDFAFLHGGGQGSWVWNETIAALQSQLGNSAKLLALDVPGCGIKRDRASEMIDNNEIAHELVADLERAGLQNIVLVGHSQAGQVLPLMAALKPGLFRRLIYLACSIPREGQNVPQMMGRGQHGDNHDEVGFPFDPKTEKLSDRYPQMFCNDMSPEQATAFLAKLGNDSWPMPSYTFTDWRHDRIGTVPSSYVLCLRDNILPANWQQRFAKRFRCERTIQIDAGHQAMNTQPQQLAEIILNEVH